jgi:hypothetical protein
VVIETVNMDMKVAVFRHQSLMSKLGFQEVASRSDAAFKPLDIHKPRIKV